MEQDRLRECQCGSEAVVMIQPHQGMKFCYVACTKCLMRTGEVEIRDRQKVIDTWNHRHEPNEALSLETLKAMNAEPLKHWVWIDILNGELLRWKIQPTSGYYQVQSDYTGGEAFCCGWPGLFGAFDYDKYGTGWLAYPHKPTTPR